MWSRSRRRWRRRRRRRKRAFYKLHIYDYVA